MQDEITQHMDGRETGLYIVLVFPIAFACLVTFLGARIISHFWPDFVFMLNSGLHIHHYTYGFFVLGIAGYLALIFNGPRAKFLISLLLGLGLGLAFDEFAMWLRLRDDDPARWSYDGLVTILAIFTLLLTIQPGVRFLLHHWPFSKKVLALEHKQHKLGWAKKRSRKLK